MIPVIQPLSFRLSPGITAGDLPIFLGMDIRHDRPRPFLPVVRKRRGMKRTFEFATPDALNIIRCIIYVSIPVAMHVWRNCIDRQRKSKTGRKCSCMLYADGGGERRCIHNEASRQRGRTDKTTRNDQGSNATQGAKKGNGIGGQYVGEGVVDRGSGTGRGADRTETGVWYMGCLTCSTGSGARMPRSEVRQGRVERW
jgi:hypothetical protein